MRATTATWHWDGEHHVLLREDPDPLTYRFEAVEDGDRLTAQGRLEEALLAYQSAIGNETLKPGSAHSMPITLKTRICSAFVDTLIHSLSIKWLLGLGADEAPPDHSTLTAFKRRLIDNGQVGPFEVMLADIVRLAQEKGVPFGSIQVMDSVHTVANVNVDKDRQRRKHPGRGPRDPGAGWGVKDSWPGKTARGEPKRDEKGQVVKEKLSFYGFKSHVSLNAEAEMITSVRVTPGGAYDGHELPALLKQDLDQGLPLGTVAADKGYDDGDNHELLRVKGLHSAIRLNEYRTQKKDKNKEVWLALRATPEYQRGVKERYKIERKFGEAKQGHGLGRCRYLGLVRYAIQAFLTALALNLKRMVKVLSGVNFKGRASAAG